MDPVWHEFVPLVRAVVQRLARQQERAVPEPAVEQLARNLAAVLSTCALPAPLLPTETGRPGGMAEAEVARLVAAVMADASDPFLSEVARQLIKTCLHPVFTQCRDSYRERAADGSCRRQERARTRLRVSGAPCVDCPYWTALAAADHGRLLDAGWVADAAAWRAEPDLYLPEDFRALRRWVRRQAGDNVAAD